VFRKMILCAAFFAANAVFAGCAVSQSSFFYTRAAVLKDKDRFRIVKGPNLVLGVEITDEGYDPTVEKFFYLEFNTPSPDLNFEHRVGGPTLRAHLLIRQGEKLWFIDEIEGTVSITVRKDEEMVAYVDVVARFPVEEGVEKRRQEELGPTYIFRRAIDDVRDGDALPQGGKVPR